MKMYICMKIILIVIDLFIWLFDIFVFFLKGVKTYTCAWKPGIHRETHSKKFKYTFAEIKANTTYTSLNLVFQKFYLNFTS